MRTAIYNIFMNGVFSFREKSTNVLIADIYDSLDNLEYYTSEWSKSRLKEDRANLNHDINKSLKERKKELELS